MGVDTLYIVGLALDYCVFYSAKDAKSLGYTTFVVEDATRGINPDTISEALQQMKQLNISIIKSADKWGSFFDIQQFCNFTSLYSFGIYN